MVRPGQEMPVWLGGLLIVVAIIVAVLAAVIVPAMFFMGDPGP